MNIILQTCIDNHCMNRWSGSFKERGVLAGLLEPSIYIIPPYIAREYRLASIVYGAMFSSPIQPLGYIQPNGTTGLPRVTWSGSNRYVPLDQWLPGCFKDWGILVVIPSVQDAPFRMDLEFGRLFKEELHDDCTLFLAGHSMMT
jgi:hypothetical protein